jgi:hypothetical protein
MGDRESSQAPPSRISSQAGKTANTSVRARTMRSHGQRRADTAQTKAAAVEPVTVIAPSTCRKSGKFQLSGRRIASI